MTNHNIDLPSRRALRRGTLLMEIERPLRRKFRSKTDQESFYHLLLILVVAGLVLVSMLHFFIEPNLI